MRHPKYIILIFSLFFLLLGMNNGFAQGSIRDEVIAGQPPMRTEDDVDVPPVDPNNPGCDPLNPACPIDGGLVALLAVGVGYGVKRVRDANKETPNTE